MKWYMMCPLQDGHRHKDVCWTKNGLNYTFMVSLQRRQWHPTPVLLPGKSHGWRSLVG